MIVPVRKEDPLDQVLQLAALDHPDPVVPYDPLTHALEIVGQSGISNRRVVGTVEAHLWAKFMRAKQLQKARPAHLTGNTQARMT